MRQVARKSENHILTLLLYLNWYIPSGNRGEVVELLKTFVSAVAARAVYDIADALRERIERRKKAPRKPGKHFRKEP